MFVILKAKKKSRQRFCFKSRVSVPATVRSLFLLGKQIQQLI